MPGFAGHPTNNATFAVRVEKFLTQVPAPNVAVAFRRVAAQATADQVPADGWAASTFWYDVVEGWRSPKLVTAIGATMAPSVVYRLSSAFTRNEGGPLDEGASYADHINTVCR